MTQQGNPVNSLHSQLIFVFMCIIQFVIDDSFIMSQLQACYIWIEHKVGGVDIDIIGDEV